VNRIFMLLPVAAIVSLFVSQMAFAFAPTFNYEKIRGEETFACHATYPSGFKEVVHLNNCRNPDPALTYREISADFFGCVATYSSGFSETVHLNNCRVGAEFKFEPFLDTDTTSRCVAIYDSGFAEVVHLNNCRDQNPSFKYEPLVSDAAPTCVATHTSGFRETVHINNCRD
jgi:hypothetical protein